MKSKISFLAVSTCLALLACAPLARAQTTAFTYQGSLQQSGSTATGAFDLQFGLFTNLSGGTAVLTITNTAVAVSNGLFTTTLDFSNAFNGSSFWLNVGVRTNGSVGAFTSLTPRQAITAAPYALFAPSAGTVSGVLAASNLPPTVALLNSSPTFTGTVTAGNFSGNGSGLTNLPSTPAANGFLFAYDTTTQTFAAGVNNFQTVTFNTPANTNGWNLPTTFLGPPFPSFTVVNGGLYMCQYQAQFTGATNATRTVSMRAILNLNGNAEIPGSQTAGTLGTNGVTSIHKTFFATFNANDVLSIQFTTDATPTTIAPAGTSVFTTTKPSASLSIIRVD